MTVAEKACIARLDAAKPISRTATVSGASIVFFASSEGAKTDRVQRDIGTGGALTTFGLSRMQSFSMS